MAEFIIRSPISGQITTRIAAPPRWNLLPARFFDPPPNPIDLPFHENARSLRRVKETERLPSMVAARRQEERAAQATREPEQWREREMDAERIERYAGLVDRFRTLDGDQAGAVGRRRFDALALEQDMTIDENLEAIDAAVSRGRPDQGRRRDDPYAKTICLDRADWPDRGGNSVGRRRPHQSITSSRYRDATLMLQRTISHGTRIAPWANPDG